MADRDNRNTTPTVDIPDTFDELQSHWDGRQDALDNPAAQRDPAQAPGRIENPLEPKYRISGDDLGKETATVLIQNAKGETIASSVEELSKMNSTRQFAELLGLDRPDRELSAEKPTATMYFIDTDGRTLNTLTVSAGDVERLFGADEEHPQMPWDGNSLNFSMGAGPKLDVPISERLTVVDRSTGQNVKEGTDLSPFFEGMIRGIDPSQN